MKLRIVLSVVPILALFALAAGCDVRDRTSYASHAVVIHPLPGGSCVAIAAIERDGKSLALAMTEVKCPPEAK